ncbi:glycosyltransferase family 2 protein [Synechococcus sp. W4D4]|uniref:glycosyltransferase family 2 protein n=1 Tax=Synechococcus sp. W4D4 TaxID=3392294 RepID=UPI0039E94C09
MQPVVSVITPYRNAEKFLLRFVSSIQAQTRTDWVCIMVDDGSTDNGPNLLRNIVSGDSRFHLINNTFSKSWPGPAAARNCALAMVSTDLVAFCDVDDVWHPEKLERQLSFHIANHLDLSVSAYGRFLDGDLSHPLRSIVCPPLKLSPGTLNGKNPIPMLTVVISAELANLRFQQTPHEDFLFWLEILRFYPTLRYGCLPSVLAFYCIHDSNLSSSKLLMTVWTYRVFRRFGKTRISSLCSLVSWMIGHFISQLKLISKMHYISTSLTDLLVQPPINTRQSP